MVQTCGEDGIACARRTGVFPGGWQLLPPERLCGLVLNVCVALSLALHVWQQRLLWRSRRAAWTLRAQRLRAASRQEQQLTMRRGLVDALLRCASASGRGALEQAGPSSSIIQCSLGAGLDHAAAACSCVASDVPHALEAPDAAAGAADRREARRRLSIGVMSQALPSAPGSAAGTCSRHFHDGVHEQQPLLALPPPASPCWPHAASDAACTSPPGPQQQHHQQAGAEHSQHQHLDHVPLCHSAWPGAAGARHPQGLPDRTLSTCSAAATALANSASPALLAAATTHPSSSGTEPNLPPRLRHLPGPSALAAARAWPAAQQQQQQQRRHASTLTKAGVPNPRPEVEAALSTHHGGHVARLIHATQTLAELEQTLAKHARSLGNVHWAAAALQLERLARCAPITRWPWRGGKKHPTAVLSGLTGLVPRGQLTCCGMPVCTRQQARAAPSVAASAVPRPRGLAA